MKQVGIIGFGRFGKVLAAILQKGFDVVGIDTNQKIIEEINRGHTSIREPGENSAKKILGIYENVLEKI